jgi:hypothetical protein
MSYYWVNGFNGVERDGPYRTVASARKSVVGIMRSIANGFAFDIRILDDSGRTVENGHIKRGKWITGDYYPDKHPGADPAARGEALSR